MRLTIIQYFESLKMIFLEDVILLKGTILKLRKRPIAHNFKRVKGKKHINLISRNSNFMACN